LGENECIYNKDDKTMFLIIHSVFLFSLTVGLPLQIWNSFLALIWLK